MGARIELRRRLEWIDTDGAGYWHHGTLWRYAEWAEGELHRALGIVDDTFGATPRRRLEAEFHSPIYFDDLVTVRLDVANVGRSSATYEVELAVGERTAATARIVIVFIDGDGRAAPWPARCAAALRGEVTA